MAKHVEAITGFQDRLARSVILSRIDGEPAFELQRLPEPLVNIRQGFDVSATVGEHQPKFTLRADLLPLARRIDDHRDEGDVPFAGFRFRIAHFLPGVSSPPDMDVAAVKIDIPPEQAAQLARSHASGDASPTWWVLCGDVPGGDDQEWDNAVKVILEGIATKKLPVAMQ